MEEAVFTVRPVKRGEHMIVLGLTGGIASGKSTASQWFISQGIRVLDADKMNHHLLNFNQEVIDQISKSFSKDVIKNGKIDRETLGKMVFNDPNKRKQLEQIVHPVIKSMIKEELSAHQNEPLIVLDVPLLFETDFDQLCHQTLVIYVDEKTQISRLMTRNHFSKEESLKRISAQMSLTEKAKKATYVISNEGTKEEMYEQLKQLYEQLIGV
jgi:dephospho-CoA kinase